jgi:hypothetical protein
MCFAAAVYSLWKMRNDKIFNNKRPNRRQLLTQVADLIKLWAYRSGNLGQEMRTWALELQIDGWRVVDDDDYNQSVGNPKRKV